MKLCRVIGPVVATANCKRATQAKALSVQPVDEQGAATGSVSGRR